MPTVKSYSPAQFSIAVAGITLSGFANGTFITAERTNETWTIEPGADGEVTRIQSTDKTGTVKVTLAQSSDSNDVLSNFYLADEKTGKGAFPVLCKDGSGTSLFSGAVAMISKPAVAGFGKGGVETREWIFLVAHLEMFVGGNADIVTV